MHCLFVKAPFAGWIVDGVKPIEYRTRETYLRGRIGIIESGSGTVIGDVELTQCLPHPDEENFFCWILVNPRRYVTPVPFEHKRGMMTWAILDIDPEAQEIAPQLPPKDFCREVAQYNRELDKWMQKIEQHRAEEAE